MPRRSRKAVDYDGSEFTEKVKKEWKISRGTSKTVRTTSGKVPQTDCGTLPEVLGVVFFAFVDGLEMIVYTSSGFMCPALKIWLQK